MHAWPFGLIVAITVGLARCVKYVAGLLDSLSARRLQRHVFDAGMKSAKDGRLFARHCLDLVIAPLAEGRDGEPAPHRSGSAARLPAIPCAIHRTRHRSHGSP